MMINGLDIAVKKSNRKTVSIFVERDGSVSARVPEKLDSEEIKEVLISKEYQIHKNLAEWKLLNDRSVEREFVNGQSFLYLGRNYRLQLIESDDNQLRFSKGRFYLSQSEKSKAKEHFTRFYRNKLKEKLPSIVNRYKKQLGVQPKEIKVMELQNRWASCSKIGNVNFHWKCAMAPIDVLHYIVVHELAHLIHLNHTPEFWNEVDKVLPSYEKQKHWLKLNGAGMDL